MSILFCEVIQSGKCPYVNDVMHSDKETQKMISIDLKWKREKKRKKIFRNDRRIARMSKSPLIIIFREIKEGLQLL